MADRITVESIEEIKERIYNLVLESQKKLKDCDYIDVRVEASESKFATAQKGAPKEGAEESQMSFGVRVIAGDGLKAPGYSSSYIGPSDLMDMEKSIKKAVEHAWRRALANASQKAEMKGILGFLGESIYSTNLARVEIYRDTLALDFKEDPRNVLLEDIIKEAVGVSESVENLYESHGYNMIHLYTTLVRQLFASSPDLSPN